MRKIVIITSAFIEIQNMRGYGLKMPSVTGIGPCFFCCEERAEHLHQF